MFTRFHLGDEIVDPLRMTADEFRPAVVADALAHINRYNGNGRFKISVAYHSLKLAQCVPDHLKLAALTHDVPEVFCGDVNGPLLAMLAPRLVNFQNEVTRNLAKILRIPYTDYMEILPFDRRIATDEREAIFPNTDTWRTENTPKGLGVSFEPQTPSFVREQWLCLFHECA